MRGTTFLAEMLWRPIMGHSRADVWITGGGGECGLHARREENQVTYSALTVLFYSFLFGALTLCGFYLVELGPTLNISTQIMVLIVAIAFVPTLMGYGLYTLSLRFTEAGRSSITSSIEPAAAIFLAYLFLGEIITPIQLLGTGLIILGAIILQVKK